MKTRILLLLLACSQLTLAATSPYAGQENRQIKSLSSEEIDAYLAGKGMGLAKAAELNGYPGPAHVLELASQLNLLPAQREATQALFASMQSQAQTLGRALVEEERKLNQLFASHAITPVELQTSLATIGSLQAKLRDTHLQAHLDQLRILSSEQSARYAQLRGYDTSETPMHKGGAHEH